MKYDLDHIKSMHIGMVRDLSIIECMNDLLPELRVILDLELQAGNFVIDAFRDWPDPGSVFITLLEPFHGKYEVSDPVKYSEQTDAHYWKADYSGGKPVHILAY